MNKEQADRLATLRYFLENNITDKQYDHEAIFKGNGLIGRFFNAWDVEDAVCCSLGWCTVVFPDTFSFMWNFDSVQLCIDKQMGFFNEDITDYFGLTCYEARNLFTSIQKRTRKQQIKKITMVMHTYGWE